MIEGRINKHIIYHHNNSMSLNTRERGVGGESKDKDMMIKRGRQKEVMPDQNHWMEWNHLTMNP